jgi:hypothetical protein
MGGKLRPVRFTPTMHCIAELGGIRLRGRNLWVVMSHTGGVREGSGHAGIAASGIRESD